MAAASSRWVPRDRRPLPATVMFPHGDCQAPRAAGITLKGPCSQSTQQTPTLWHPPVHPLLLPTSRRGLPWGGRRELEVPRCSGWWQQHK